MSEGIERICRVLVPLVQIGDYAYLTADQIAEALDVPLYHIINAVRERGLSGRKLGKRWLIAANDFYDWINSGHFESPSKERETCQPNASETSAPIN